MQRQLVGAKKFGATGVRRGCTFGAEVWAGWQIIHLAVGAVRKSLPRPCPERKRKRKRRRGSMFFYHRTVLKKHRAAFGLALSLAANVDGNSGETEAEAVVLITGRYAVAERCTATSGIVEPAAAPVHSS
jgi:hypothetical protein